MPILKFPVGQKLGSPRLQRRLLIAPRRWWTVALLGFAATLLVNGAVLAHGSILEPLSRVMHCRFVDDPENPAGAACAAAVAWSGDPQFLYDWNGIRQGDADGAHQSVVPDGEICAGGGPEFGGLNLARADWVATPIEADENGEFEFIYQATAPHSTRDMLFYVTRDGWDPTVPLTWADLDADPSGPAGVIEPFCHLTDATLEDYPGISDQVYRMACPLPVRTGRHVIFNVWQRDDSPEAFYSCSDVEFTGVPAIFANGFETGNTTEWSQTIP